MDGVLRGLYENCMDFDVAQLDSTRRLEGQVNTSAVATNGTIGESMELRVRALESGSLESQFGSENSWYGALLTEVLQIATSSLRQGSSQSSLLLTFAIEQVEKMTCLFSEECRGQVKDFTNEFRHTFQWHNGSSSSTPCRQIIDNIQTKKDHIQVPNWRSVVQKYLKC